MARSVTPRAASLFPYGHSGLHVLLVEQLQPIMPSSERPVVRLPLQTGASSLRSLTSGAFSAAIAIAFVVYIKDFTAGLDPIARWILLVSGAVVPVLAIAPIKRSWLRRPSDLIFSATGFRIEGGHGHGLTIAYADIHPNQCILHEDYRKNSAGLHTTALKVNGKILATADEEEEVQSLEEVRAAILSRRVVHQPQAKADPKPIDDTVLVCPSCGAPTAPSRDEVVRCRHCGSEVPIPETLRARVIAADELPDNEAWVRHALAGILDQPPAPVVTKRMMASVLLSLVACPLSYAIYTHARLHHAIGVWLGAGLTSLPFALILIGYFISRLPIVDRHAARELIVTFGARAPDRPSGSPLCRRCNAPLPTTAGIVVICVYCQSANILGLDLRIRAQNVEGSRRTLEAALNARSEERRTWSTLVGIGSVMAVAITVWVIVISLE